MAEEALPRRLTLRGAVTLNLLDMIGVGPFITLPLLMAAMGGTQAMLGWVLGALLAMCDGLVWAELGAALPQSGGTYHFLRVAYPGRWGEWLSFLFLCQLLLSAPLSIASGAVGLAQYAGVLLPHARQSWYATGSATHAILTPTVMLAMGAVVLAAVLLARRVDRIARLGFLLLGVVLFLLGWSIVTGALLGHSHRILQASPIAWHPDRNFWFGLGSAMLIATYDYWGYYNVAFLAGEVQRPERNVPRAILISIGVVAICYLLLNLSVLRVLPVSSLLAGGDPETRRAMLAVFMRTAYAPVVGVHAAMWLARGAAALVCVTAFASVMTLLLGYSRVPYAAAREGGFFAVFGKVASGHAFPWVSLLSISVLAVLACTLSLPQIIASLVIVRVVLQFLMQHVGVMLLRKRQPGLRRPFRIWLYPLPPVLAIAGFLYILFSRAHAVRSLWPVVVIVGVGTLLWTANRIRRAAPRVN